jgi:thymidylate synthase
MNRQYRQMLSVVFNAGEKLVTRNHQVRRGFLPEFYVTGTPLITIRHTAWKKALREMQWFLSGYNKPCPPELRGWWAGQLSPDGRYINGYGDQLCNDHNQIETLIAGLVDHPNSRRHILTTWNPSDMFWITRDNENPRTPTTCHGSFVQFFVIHDTLSMYHYQRSADMLLGLPHNLMQYWALLLYIAHRAGLKPSSIIYKIGDAHIYDHPSHNEVVEAILDIDPVNIHNSTRELIYRPPTNTYQFRECDFSMSGKPAKPLVTGKPKLF